MCNMNVYIPETLLEVSHFLKRGNSRILAGGTDILLKRDELIKQGIDLIDLSRLGELSFVEEKKGFINIGAMTTFSQLGDNIIINRFLPALAQAARQLGSMQIRNRATIGGNVANASPAADSLPVLMAYRTRVKVMLTDGSIRYYELEDIIKEIDDNKLILSFILPLRSPAANFSYYNKIGSRKSVTIARINLAALINYQFEDNKNNVIIKKARIVLGALGKVPFRADKAEQIISGCSLSSEVEQEFLDELTKTVDQAIPGRYSQPYKRNAIQGLGDDLIKAFKGGLNNE